MEHGLGSESVPTGPIDKSRVLSVKPLRCLVPIFPSQPDPSNPGSSPFASAPPNGPFPSGAAPFYPFFMPNESSQRTRNSQTAFPSPVPLNSYRTPPPATGTRKNSSSRRHGEDAFSNSQGRSFATDVEEEEEEEEEDTSVVGGTQKRISRRRKAAAASRGGDSSGGSEVDVHALAEEYMQSFNLIELDAYQGPDGEKELTARVLLVYNLLRRKITRLDESKNPIPGITRRPDLRCGTVLMSKGVRANASKRIGAVPGIEVGDIFFFRMEMCLLGLHAPTMAGIDYMSVKITGEEEPIAVSIVSSGGYEDDGDDGDVLIYSGQGGVQRRDKQFMDQKLERGNLALEKSLHRANEVRVIRGFKDEVNPTPTAKVYVYDGLYKIHVLGRE